MKTIQIRHMTLGEGRPKICVPLTDETQDDLIKEVALVKAAGADLVEWRVDFFKQLNQTTSVLDTARALRQVLGDMPLLFTLRTKNEGGQKDISTSDYLALIGNVLNSDTIDMLDVELFTGDSEVRKLVELAHQKGVVVVMSSHDFQATPPKEEILARLGKMRTLGADVPKLAAMPQNFADVLTLMQASDEYARRASCPLITMSMSALGVISRVSGHLSGSCLTFGSVRRASAPGQLSVSDLVQVINILG